MPRAATRARARRWRTSGASVSEAAAFSPFQRSPLDMLLGRWSLDHSPAYVAIDMMARVFSPYELDRRQPIRWPRSWPKSIDFARLAAARSSSSSRRPTCAPAGPRVFRNAELTPDVLLASACLPTMFQAVEIDGEAYWDGGYSGNPTMTPLVRNAMSDDTILVADQSGRAPRHAAVGARHPQPPERGVVQRRAAEGTADDGAAAQGRDRRRRRRSRTGRACAST